MRPLHSLRFGATATGAILGIAVLAAACGGGGSSSSTPTAPRAAPTSSTAGATTNFTATTTGSAGTAAATAATSAATTGAPLSAAGYKTKAQADVAKLTKQTDALLQDMQTAQLSQSDPKWPGIFNGDADAIVTTANDLKSLNPPAGPYTNTQAQLSKAADKLIEGAGYMKKSVETGDNSTGAQAFFALTQGKGMLTDASSALK